MKALQATDAMKAYWSTVINAGGGMVYEREEATQPSCEVCDGMGWIAYDVRPDHPEFGKPHACPNPTCPTVQGQSSTRYSKLCTAAQIPEEYEDLTMARWHRLEGRADWISGKRTALGAAKAFLAARHDWEKPFYFTIGDAEAAADLSPEDDTDGKKKNSLVLQGANGVGKTSLCCAIAQELLAAHIPVLYIRLDKYFSELQSHMNRHVVVDEGYGSTVDAADKTITEVPVLILDELGLDQATEWRRGTLQALLNHRYTHRLPTLITTNLTRDQLCAQWGLTTASRVYAMCHWIEMGGRELRHRGSVVKSR